MTYAPIFDKAVYVIDSEAESDAGKVTVKSLVLPKRYVEPTEDGVVAYLQQKATSLDAAASLVIPDSVRRGGKNLLEEMIMTLPNEVRGHLKSGYKNCMEFVRNHTLAPAVQVGDQYIFVRFGMLTEELHRANKEAGQIIGAAWYDAALSDKELRDHGLGERWNMKILLADGKLPDRNEMNILLKHGVHGSATLEISRVKYPHDQVREVIDFVYDNFSTTEYIAQLPDISDVILDEHALRPVLALIEYSKEQVQKQNLMQQIMTEHLRARPRNGKNRLD